MAHSSPSPQLPHSHDHDEFLQEAIFLEGIEVYVDLITQLTQLPF
jgi:hypothetical protein